MARAAAVLWRWAPSQKGKIHGKIQRKKAVYRAGGGPDRLFDGLCIGDEPAHRPAARDEHTLPDGGDGVPRRQPRKGGGRSLRGAGKRPGHGGGRIQHYFHLGGKLQHRAAGLCGRHRHEQRHGQGVQHPGPERRQPARHLPDPLHPGAEHGHELFDDGGRGPGRRRYL